VTKSQVYVTNTQAAIASPTHSLTLATEFDILGRWFNNYNTANSVNDAIISGSRSSGFASGTSFSISYGATCVTRPGVVYGYFSTTSASHRLSSFSTTGFTVVTSSSLVCDLNYWVFRHP
jgi:hypothetical protein